MGCIKTRQIKVIASPPDTPGGDFRFGMEEDGVTIDKIVSRKPQGAPDTDYEEVIFELENRNGANLEFVDTAADAMWVKRGWWIFGPPCPRESSHHPHIEATDVEPKKLTVRNYNPKKVKFKFSLNFVTSDKARAPAPYDPIWDNQNGSNRS